MANKITTAIEFQTENAKSGLSGLKTAMSDAHGLTGKLGAGFKTLGTSVSSALSGPGGLAVAGTAITAAGAAALETVSKWSALGVEIGKFHDATGVTNEEASRLIEVTGDIGISADTVESSLGKMNKAAGNTPGLFKNAGIEIAHTKDGAVDANQTFLNVIDRLNKIEDPAKRAALATKLLGKGWQDMSELIGQGSDKVKKSLAAVEDQKVFDDGKVAQARAFRKTMDDLHDTLEDLALTAGKDLLPAIKELVQDLVALVHAGEDVSHAFGKVSDTMSVDVFTTDPVQKMIDKINQMKETSLAAVGDMDAAHHKLADGAMAGLINAEDEATQAMDEMKRHSQMTTDSIKRGLDQDKDALDRLKGGVSDDAAWTDLELTFEDVKQKGQEAFQATSEGSDDAKKKTLEYAAALDGLKTQVIDYGTEVLKLPVEQVTKIVAAVDPQSLDEAEALLAALTRNREVSLDIIAHGGAGYGPLSGARAAGGPVSAGGNYLVGENGPEVVHMGGNGTVIPNGAMGGGDVHIHVQIMPTPNELVSILKKYEMRNGAGWRS